MEFGSASKLDFSKSSTRMYLNLKMQEPTYDSLLGPSTIFGNEMVLILLFSFPKNLGTFSSSYSGQSTSSIETCRTFVEIFLQSKFNVLQSGLATNNARSCTRSCILNSQNNPISSNSTS